MRMQNPNQQWNSNQNDVIADEADEDYDQSNMSGV